MGWLEGKVALVTGGGSGIGYAITKRFIEEGAKVGILEYSKEKVIQLKDDFGDSVAVIQGNVTSLKDNQQAISETVKAFDKLDTFVGNAGIFDYFVSLSELSEQQIEESFNQVFNVNVKGILLGAKAALSELRKTKGSMIFTLSNSSFYSAGGGPLYTSSKHAVVGLIKQLAYELAPLIRVNGVAPGGTITDLRGPTALGQENKSLSDLRGVVKGYNALQLVAEPEDHTGAYVLLASKKNSRMMTGVIIQSDGGMGVRGLKQLSGGTEE